MTKKIKYVKQPKYRWVCVTCGDLSKWKWESKIHAKVAFTNIKEKPHFVTKIKMIKQNPELLSIQQKEIVTSKIGLK